MSFTSSVQMTGSKYFAILILAAGLAGAIVLKESSVIITAMTCSAGLYVSKQTNDTFKEKYKNGDIQHK